MDEFQLPDTETNLAKGKGGGFGGMAWSRGQNTSTLGSESEGPRRIKTSSRAFATPAKSGLFGFEPGPMHPEYEEPLGNNDMNEPLF